MHKTIIIGNLGANPEQRQVGWDNVTNFTVAVNQRWKDNEGERREAVLWFRISAWGKLGEVCQKHLRKGRKVYIEGQLSADSDSGGPRTWLREDGSPAAAFELRAEAIEFLDPPQESQPTE